MPYLLVLCDQIVIICLMSDGVPIAPCDLSRGCECSVLQKIGSCVSLGVGVEEHVCLKSLQE